MTIRNPSESARNLRVFTAKVGPAFRERGSRSGLGGAWLRTRSRKNFKISDSTRARFICSSSAIWAQTTERRISRISPFQVLLSSEQSKITRELRESIEGVVAPAVGLAVHNTVFRAKMAQIAELLKRSLPLLGPTATSRLLALLLAV